MLNKSYSYLLPLIDTRCHFDKDYYIMIDNVYSRYNDIDYYFVIGYSLSDDVEFNAYITELKDNPLFFEEFKDEVSIYLVYRCPEEFTQDFEYFYAGKFSEFKEESKIIVINYMLDTHKLGNAERFRQIFYKDIKLRLSIEEKLKVKLDKNMELSSIPRKDDENINNINSKLCILNEKISPISYGIK